MTATSLVKYIIGVNRVVIEDAEKEYTESGLALIIKVRPIKKDRCRCPICGKKCSKYDQGSGRRRWRTLDLEGGIKVYLESDSQRVRCKEHGVLVQKVPWARYGSKHTKSFEETAVWLSLQMSRKAVSEYLRVSWDTVGQMISRVEKETGPGKKRFDGLVNIGIDETSYTKGHKYITVIINHDTNGVIWAAQGFGKDVLESFFEELTPAQRSSIQLVSGDGARWIKDVVADYCPEATFCLDPYHVVSWCEEVLDIVRKQQWNKARAKVAAEKKEQGMQGRGRPKGGSREKTEAQKEEAMMKGARYPLLMNPDKLSEASQAKLDEILIFDKRLSIAYQLKEWLRAILHHPVEEVRELLEKWRRRAWTSRIPEYVELQRKIQRNIDAIVATVRHGITNARVEAINNKIKVTIRMGYGFRNIGNLISLIYLRCGGRKIYLPGRVPQKAT